MDITEFKQNFNGYQVTDEFIKLNYFENNHARYSQGFYLVADGKAGAKTWSDNKDFLDRLMPFAQANGTGSTYGIWNDGSNRALNELPIIVFGDEGGVHIVAEHILQLMQLLTFDSEITVDFDKAYFYKDESDYEESEDSTTFKSWLKENFSLDTTSEPNEIIERAQGKYKAAFDKWFGQYYALG